MLFQVPLDAATLPWRVTAVPWSAGTSQKGFHPVHPNRRLNPRALAVALAILLLPVTAGAVSAGYGKPTIVLSASVSNGTPFVEAVVSRQSKQINSCVYVLDGDAPADCGWRLGSATHTRFTLVLSDLPVGDHTVTVTVRLTDNEEISNSISFPVAAPPTLVLRASVSNGTPFVDARVNRNPEQVESCSYVLDDDTATGCGWILGSHISSIWTLVPNEPSVGDHPVTVTVVLTDHERLTSSISFPVAAPTTAS